MKVFTSSRVLLYFLSLLFLFGCQKDNCEDYIWYIDSDNDGLGEEKVTAKGCEKPEGFVDNNDDVFYLGAFHEGGLIFYLDPTGEHGVVCAARDMGAFSWQSGKDACEASTREGYTDWRMPQLYELDDMYTNLHLEGLGEFRDDGYWSADTGIDPGTKYYKNFANGSTKVVTSGIKQVRQVRSF